MRWLRWNYILPRLIALLGIGIAVEYSAGYVLKWALIDVGQASLGARVDIGEVQASLLNTHLLVTDLQVANPRSPRKNLLEAERVELDFDSAAALRKKLVANYGVVSGLQFSSPRMTSGALPDQQAKESQGPRFTIPPAAQRYAAEWLDSLQTRLTTDLRNEYESIRLAEELAERWPQKYRDLEASVRAFRDQAKRFEEQVREAHRNPLRNTDFLTQLPQQTAQLRRSLRELQEELANLPGQLQADRQAVELARQRDEQRLREQLALERLDPKQLADYLLGDELTEPLYSAIGWIAWARQLMPIQEAASEEKSPHPPSQRGEDVLFAGVKPLPNFWVKKLRLEGAARFAGQPVELAGMLRNWTSEPERLKEPTTLELMTISGMPLKLYAKLDRSRKMPCDAMHLESNGLLLPQLDLGSRKALLVTLAPGAANLAIDLTLQGDRLSGELRLDQYNVAITPYVGSLPQATSLLPAAAPWGQQLEAALTKSLAEVHQATTQLTLRGTLEAPELQLTSTLSTAITDAVNHAASDLVQVATDQLVERGRQELDLHLNELIRLAEQQMTSLEGELGEPGEIVARLLGQRPLPDVSRLPFGWRAK